MLLFLITFVVNLTADLDRPRAFEGSDCLTVRRNCHSVRRKLRQERIAKWVFLRHGRAR